MTVPSGPAATGDVRGFYQALGIELPGSARANAYVSCFASPELHQNDDRTHSTSVSVQHGAWKCHGCGERGGAYDAALSRGHDEESAKALMRKHGLKMLGARSPGRAPWPRPAATRRQSFDDGQRCPPSPPPALGASDRDVRSWVAALAAQPAVIGHLARERGWDRGVVQALEVGRAGDGRITFPIRGPAGELLGVLRYLAWRNPGQEKMRAVPGTRLRLIPHPSAEPSRFLAVLEGPPDMVSARSLGAPALCTPSAEAWCSEWAEDLRGRRVTVIMDADRAGRSAALRIADDLIAHQCQVDIADLAPGRGDGYDFTDALMERGRAPWPNATVDPLDEFRGWLGDPDVGRIGVSAIRSAPGLMEEATTDLVRRGVELRALFWQGRLLDEARRWKDAHGTNAIRALVIGEARRRLGVERDEGAKGSVTGPLDRFRGMLGDDYVQAAGREALAVCDRWQRSGRLRDKAFLAAASRELDERESPFDALRKIASGWPKRTVEECRVSVEGVAAELVAVRRELAWRWLVERVRDRVAVAAELDVRVGGVREGGGDHGLAAAGELGGGRVSAARIGRRFRRCERLMGGDGRGLVERLTVGYREQLRRESTRVLVALRAELPDLWAELGRKDVARGARRYQSLCRDWGVAWRERRSELRRIAGEGQELWVSGVHPHAWLERAHFAAQVAAIDQHLVERGVVLEPDPGLERPPPTPEINPVLAIGA